MEIAIPAGLSSLFALVLPWLIAKINLKVESKKWRYVISLAVSGALGSIVTVLTGNFDPESFFASITAAATVSQTIYATYWRDRIVAWRQAMGVK
jgi:hypothetical protein